MITIRRALDADFPAIEEILALLNLGHPSILPEGFWVADIDGQIVGITNIEDCGECFYVNAVGVKSEYQKKGVARVLLGKILPSLQKDAYLYSKIPEFFARFGFVESAIAPLSVPPREIYGCERCGDRLVCLCMVRRFDAAKIS